MSMAASAAMSRVVISCSPLPTHRVAFLVFFVDANSKRCNARARICVYACMYVCICAQMHVISVYFIKL